MGSPIPHDSVVLLGRAEFDPPLQMGQYAGADPYGRMSHLLIGFTYAADTEVDISSMSHGLDEWTQVLPGQVFAVRAPRRVLFLRVLSMYLGSHATGRTAFVPHAEAVIELDWIRCYTVHRIAPEPSDRFVYIGTVRCAHDGGVPSRVTVVDDYAGNEAEFAPLIGTEPVVRR